MQVGIYVMLDAGATIRSSIKISAFYYHFVVTFTYLIGELNNQRYKKMH